MLGVQEDVYRFLYLTDRYWQPSWITKNRNL